MKRSIIAAAALGMAGCSWLRWQGYQTRPQSVAEKRGPAAAAGISPNAEVREPLPARITPSVAHPQPEQFTDENLQARYYYDLGPKTLDVSRYPEEQRYNYAVFARVCSQCHTLARPISSPRSSFWAWRYYVYRMRLHGRFSAGKGFSEREAQRIVSFLAYDSLQRKDKDREDFEFLTRKLERRFDDVLAERARRIKETAPAPK